MATLEELLDRRELRTAGLAAYQVDTIRMEEATSSPQHQLVPPPTSHPSLLLMSVVTLVTRMTMALPPGTMNRDKIEEVLT